MYEIILIFRMIYLLERKSNTQRGERHRQGQTGTGSIHRFIHLQQPGLSGQSQEFRLHPGLPRDCQGSSPVSAGSWIRNVLPGPELGSPFTCQCSKWRLNTLDHRKPAPTFFPLLYQCILFYTKNIFFLSLQVIFLESFSELCFQNYFKHLQIQVCLYYSLKPSK